MKQRDIIRGFICSVLVVITIIVCAAWIIPPMLVEPVSKASDYEKILRAENDYRTSILATAQIILSSCTAIGLIFTVVYTAKNFRITEKNVNTTASIASSNLSALQDGKLTERFSKAIEQLGSDSVAVRTGAIYALGRVASDSCKDHWTVMEILCAFIREKRPLNSRLKVTEEDIKAAVSVIKSRKHKLEIYDQRLDLSMTNLDGLNFSASVLNFIILDNSSLVGTNFNGADLTDADMASVNATSSQFIDTTLKRSFLSGATLTNAIMTNADLTESVLDNAIFQDVIGPLIGVKDDQRDSTKKWEIVD